MKGGIDLEWKRAGLVTIIICAVLAVALIVVVIGDSQQSAVKRNGGMMMDTDRMFIEQMIPHHQDAVDMGEMALVKAEHPELKMLAGNIIRDQSREISLMKGWYGEWYGIGVPENRAMGMMGGGMGGNMTDLRKLGNTTPFDKEFIEQMIPHHQMAIMMARMVTQNANHAEVRELGSSIIASQSAEVEMMQGWYRTWYGKEVPVSSHMGP